MHGTIDRERVAKRSKSEENTNQGALVGNLTPLGSSIDFRCLPSCAHVPIHERQQRRAKAASLWVGMIDTGAVDASELPLMRLSCACHV